MDVLNWITKKWKVSTLSPTLVTNLLVANVILMWLKLIVTLQPNNLLGALAKFCYISGLLSYGNVGLEILAHEADLFS